MGHDESEIARRTALAVKAIKKALVGGNDQVALFISHHLEEVEESYWHQHAGTARPTPEQVLDLLIMVQHWDDEGDEGIRTFDFTLPADATNYVIAVYFNDDGKVDYITMES